MMTEMNMVALLELVKLKNEKPDEYTKLLKDLSEVMIDVAKIALRIHQEIESGEIRC